MALEVLPASTVRVGGEVFPLDELERALRSTGRRPPYRVEISREVEAGEFEEVWGLYEALNALHEAGTVASISPESPGGQPDGHDAMGKTQHLDGDSGLGNRPLYPVWQVRQRLSALGHPGQGGE